MTSVGELLAAPPPTGGSLLLYEALSSALFYNRDRVTSSDVIVDQPVEVSFIESENVTCAKPDAPCSWSVDHDWTYPFLVRSDDGGEQPSSPPAGVRSAPPLGGIGAGSVELRADGTLTQWTVFNQHPASSGKYGVVDDAVLFVRAHGDGGGGEARPVRTRIPASLGGRAQPLSSIGFSGSYPATRLDLDSASDDLGLDPGVSVSVQAYSPIKPGSPEDAAHPAVVFTMMVSNAADEEVTLDLALALPLGGWTDCSRRSEDGVAFEAASTSAECAKACADAGADAGVDAVADAAGAGSGPTLGCLSWEFDRGAGRCTHNPDVPLTAHATGLDCGVVGGWTAVEPPPPDDWARGRQQHTALVWNQPAGGEGPSAGNVTLLPVGGSRSSVGVADGLSTLWEAFESDGAFGPSLQPSAWSHRAGSSSFPTHGAASATVAVPPGGNATASIVFAWWFPLRDYRSSGNRTEVIGNYYSRLFDNRRGSLAVARSLGDESSLTSVASSIAAHHRSVAPPDSPAPDWLKDSLLNQFSHLHMLLWLADGRMREYEAWSCDDVDSVHNDYQRHLLYLWLVPDLEVQKCRAFGTFGMAADGHVHEWLAAPGHNGLLDRPGGRVMGDTTTIWLIELRELLTSGAADIGFVSSLWPAARRALR